MPYLNTTTSSFGHTIHDVRAAYPETSIPEGASFGDFAWYTPADPQAHDPRTHVAVEIAPVNGVQQWRIDPAPVGHVIASVQQAVQQRLDDFARTRNYDGIMSAATYATSTVPGFAAEGQYAVQARDASWAACYQIMADVQAGLRPMPASIQDVLDELPALEWPQ